MVRRLRFTKPKNFLFYNIPHACYRVRTCYAFQKINNKKTPSSAHRIAELGTVKLDRSYGKGWVVDTKTINWQGEQIEAFAAASTEAELYEVLNSAARGLGFDYLAFGLRQPLPFSNPKTHLINNYPTEWQERYAREAYLAVDPTVAHGIRSVAPLVWTEHLFRSAPAFWEDAHAHGIRYGWAQSHYDAQGSVGMLTLARSHEALTDVELKKNMFNLSWLMQAVHEQMTRIVLAKQPRLPAVALTAREIEVLRWTADGKTSGEIGQIMDISERTVNFHINNSLEKLNAVNKTALVIKAAMLRLL